MDIRTNLALPVACLAMLLAACGDPEQPKPTVSPGSYLASRPIQAVGGKANLGEVSPCGQGAKRTIKIRNQSAEPVTIANFTSTCPCLLATLDGDRTLAPGAERDLHVEARPGGTGERSVSVEFGGKGGFLGAARVDWKVGPGAMCNPVEASVAVGERDEAIEVIVFASDGRPVKVLGMEPAVGSVAVASGERCKVLVSTFEARKALEAAGGGSTLRVAIKTDHPACPVANFDLNLGR